MADPDITKLCNAYNQITDRILECTINPKPDYNIDGQQVLHGKYLRDLITAQKHLEQQIAIFQPPFELTNDTMT